MKIKSCLKVKVYKVSVKKHPSTYYFVDAPNKRIAKWCGAALYNNEFAAFLTNKDMKVEDFEYVEGN